MRRSSRFGAGLCILGEDLDQFGIEIDERRILVAALLVPLKHGEDLPDVGPAVFLMAREFFLSGCHSVGLQVQPGRVRADDTLVYPFRGEDFVGDPGPIRLR